jgi:serine/threonine protein kinase
VTPEDDGVPRTFGDRYVLGERITAGESREVWRAHDDVVGRQVALKIFFGPAANDPTWRTAFRHDAQRLVALSHPGIAKAYEFGESDIEVWIAMAFFRATPLSGVIADDPPLAPADALDLIGQIAFALQAAHSAGVAHGALSPDNVLVREDGVAAVIGFALASGASRAADLAALGEVARDCLRGAIGAEAPPTEVEAFAGWVTGTTGAKPPADAADIGRTALALAASLEGRSAAPIVPRRRPPPATDSRDPHHDADEASRRLVRNRLIALGAIVVLGGSALLYFVQGGGEVTVPYVIGLPLNQAQIDLTSAGLRDAQVYTPATIGSGGTVVSETPPAGVRVKAGSLVTLTISGSGP